MVQAFLRRSNAVLRLEWGPRGTRPSEGCCRKLPRRAGASLRRAVARGFDPSLSKVPELAADSVSGMGRSLQAAARTFGSVPKNVSGMSVIVPGAPQSDPGTAQTVSDGPQVVPDVSKSDSGASRNVSAALQSVSDGAKSVPGALRNDPDGFKIVPDVLRSVAGRLRRLGPARSHNPNPSSYA